MASTDGRFGFADFVDYAPERAQVLVVEDERDVRKSLTRLIEKFGHEVRSASSAEEADSWISSQRFDVCLLDIQLPKMKGVEFLGWALGRDPDRERERELSRGRSLPAGDAGGRERGAHGA